MKFSIHKIVKLGVFNILLLISVTTAFASGTNNYSHTSATQYISSLFVNEEENEKNINNVKAFYNPVSQQINVSFRLAKQGTVSIKLMDALGNEVLNLSNSTLESGNQSFAFDANDKITPGFYFLRVVVGGEAVVKRMSIR
ncbi:T9SS type A sorting domain-containing protein [Sphingobacterium pedocola]|uniref:Secretion system C-terminal sorting domain-containing protein n=1 Tax=Sphingobacterium pedocola TaxID=2082722 RepID=A0ABR9T5N7_9SPHI|nr:T9SS type A sorting domain-containing protein [Sphingobacterium pedocola]MBE8720219.1 hypothetical protein [Sphingobacterium pedocola]